MQTLSSALVVAFSLVHTAQATPCCSPGFTGFKAYNNCQQFYQCANGNVYNIQNCAGGLLFDSSINNCNWASVVTTCVVDSCAPPTMPPTPSPLPPPTPGQTPPPTSGQTPPPTRQPTWAPTRGPTRAPTLSPTPVPSAPPSPGPTPSPTAPPSLGHTSPPTRQPTLTPTRSPTRSPTLIPTSPPSPGPTPSPTRATTGTPSLSPTTVPTPIPTATPTRVPTRAPTRVPTRSPTRVPTQIPTAAPTPAPIPVTTGSPIVKVKFLIAPSLENHGYTQAEIDNELDRLNRVIAGSNLGESAGQLRYVFHSRELAPTDLSFDVFTALNLVYQQEPARGDYDVVFYLYYDTTPDGGYGGYSQLHLCKTKATVAVGNTYWGDIPVHELLHTVGARHQPTCSGTYFNHWNPDEGLSQCNKDILLDKIPTYTCLDTA